MGKLCSMIRLEFATTWRFPVLEAVILMLTIPWFFTQEVYGFISCDVILLPIALGISFSVTRSVAAEFERRELNLLLVQPVKRSIVFMSKYIAVFIVMSPILSCMLIVKIYLSGFIMIWQLVIGQFLAAIAFILLFLFALTGICFSISLVTRSQVLSAIIPILVVTVLPLLLSLVNSDLTHLIDASSFITVFAWLIAGAPSDIMVQPSQLVQRWALIAFGGQALIGLVALAIIMLYVKYMDVD